MSSVSHLEEKVLFLLKVYKFRTPVREFMFSPPRRWRFDFAYPDKKIAIECEGGIWSGGRHSRGSGFVKDCEKYNTAAKLGWRVFRYTTSNYNDIIGDLRGLDSL